MSGSLGRHALLGLAVGATAGLGLIAFVVYRELSRRRNVVSENRSAARLSGSDGEARFQEPMDANEMEAQQQALAAVEAVVQGLSPEQQLELRNQLDQVLSCMASLRSEVAELRGGLHDIALQIIQDVKKGVEDSRLVRRRHHVVHRERTDSASSSSIYFTASQGLTSTWDDSTEGGYSTACAESNYTDRDTDREDPEQESEEEEEEDEDRSCATVLTLRQEESPEEDEGDEDEGRLQLGTEVPNGELALLLAQSDILHTGDASLKAEGFRLLLENRPEHGDNKEFLWRLARAYVDMYESAEDKQEKTSYALKVPNRTQPSNNEDYKPVALTSHIMKTMERLVLGQLRPIVQPDLDPFQFPYQPHLGTEDAIIYLLNRVYAHLDKPAITLVFAGLQEAEEALQNNGLNAECHKWFAVLTGLASQHESTHSKHRSRSILKEHVDRALALRDDDPMCYYLLGRWCYEVATWDWLDKKAAAALYGSPPTCTLHTALENFLKVEELSPGFSRTVRLYIAKCYMELGNYSDATNWTKLALKIPSNSKHDEDVCKLEAELQVLADNPT